MTARNGGIAFGVEAAGVLLGRCSSTTVADLPRCSGVPILPNEGAIVTRACACGGYIAADPRTPYHAVVGHNRTLEHARWWASVRDDWQGAA